MEDLSSEWRVVDETETQSSSGCPFLRAQSYLTSSSGTGLPALPACCPHPRASAKGGERSSRCPFMRLLFLFMSMLPSASALSTVSAVPSLPKGAPTTLSASRPSHAARVPSVCGRDCRRHAPATMRRDDSLIGQSTGLGLGPDGGGDSGGKVLILGAGWMGSRVAAALGTHGEEVEVTHRPRTNLDAKDPYFRPVDLPASMPRHEFDLLSPDSWANLPAPETLAAVVVTFPVSLPTAAQFWETYLRDVPTVICYSSTSVYQIDVPGQRVDEQTTLRASPRALAESFLQQRGAQVLTLSGIVSEAAEARSICACLRGYLGRASAPHSLGKTINLVHESDIVEVTVACLQRPSHGSRFNVAGKHVALRELLRHCDSPGVFDAGASTQEDDSIFIEGGTDLSSKRVLSQRIIDEVMPAGFAFQPIVSPKVLEIDAELAAEIDDGYPPAAAGRQTMREPPEAGEYRAQLLSDILPLSAADWLSDDGSTMQEARAQRAQLLSDILPLSAADWLSEVNPLAGY